MSSLITHALPLSCFFFSRRRLKGIVHRRHYSVLADQLPLKHEYVLSVAMTPLQKTLYKTYVGKGGRDCRL